MGLRRTIERIHYDDYDRPFDQQLWPVMVALGVSCALAVGAVVALLQGTWMWIMLLVLPALAALAQSALLQMDDSKLKRSLQLAVLTSFSVHLAILIFTSAVVIFHGPPPLPQQKVVQRRSRTIEITQRANPFPWQNVVSSPIPEPDIKSLRQDTTQTNVSPQTLPTETTSATQMPQIVQRDRTRKSVPRFSKSLSALKRSVVKTLPQADPQRPSTKQLRVEATAQPAQSGSKQAPEVPKAKTQSQAARSEPLSESPLARLQREPNTVEQSAVAAVTAATRPETSSAAAAPQPEPQRSVRRQKIASTVEKKVDLMTAARASAAQKKRSRDIIPMPSMPRRLPTAQTNTQPNAQPTELSASAASLTRRPQTSDINSIAPVESEQSQKSRVSELARSVRRKTAVQLPSISSPAATADVARRATSPSLIDVTIKRQESPSRRPSSKLNANELHPQPAAMTRSTKGTSGIGKSSNVSNATGGVMTPASRASDSAKRKRELNLPNMESLMATSRKSKRARTISESNKPTSVFKADTTRAAKLSGVKKPKRDSLQSAAARIDSALSKANDEIAAAKGEASADLGLTKVVVDQVSQRRSGGGLPEIGPVKPDLTRRSSETSDRVPSLMADVTFETAAPSAMTSQPTASRDLRPNETAQFSTRQGGEFNETLDLVSAIMKGETSDSGQSPFARAFSAIDSARPLTGDPIAQLLEELLDDEKEKLAQGNRKTRVAHALLVDAGAEPIFSDTAKPKPDGDESETGIANAISDSLLGKLARQTMSPSTAFNRTATRLMVSAATTLPMFDPTLSQSAPAEAKMPKKDDLTSVMKASPVGPARILQPSELESEAEPSLVEISSTADQTDQAPPDLAVDMLANLDDIKLDRSVRPADFRLDVDADQGPAGLGAKVDLRSGADTRPSTHTSLQIEPSIEQRYQRRDFGGTLAVSPDVVLAKEAFRQRSPSAIKDVSEPSTEAAIHLGLEFLAKHQKPDGSWALGGFDTEHPLSKRQLNSDTAATGLVLLAFQGGGYNHREFKYAAPMNQAIKWLVEHQSEDGGLYLESDKRSDQACRLYSHGIATLALTEAYGMTQDPALKGPAQKAIDYIAKSQHPQKGGWRYFANPNAQSTDTSVSGWMMMAIQSAELAELQVDPAVKQKLTGWLNIAADPENESTYRYNPYAVDSKGVSRVQGLRSTPSMTSVGLLMRIYSGWDKSDPRLLSGADYLLLQQLPNTTTRKMRDTYYWYYATQVLKHVGGEQWNQWNNTLRPLLIDTQQRKGEMAGSWHPYEPVPDRWGAYGGRLYVTTMNLLSLEVRHRLLPLYRKTNQ